MASVAEQATKALVTAAFAPTVTATDHKIATPTTAALALTTYEPTVTATTGGPQTVTPSPAALVLTTFAPMVTASSGPADTPANFGLGIPDSTPPRGPDFSHTSRDPQVDSNFYALSRLAEAEMYLDVVVQWVEDQLGPDEELANPFGDDDLQVDSRLTRRRTWPKSRS